MIIYFILILATLAGLITGYQQWLSFESLNRRRVITFLVAITGIIIISGILQQAGLIAETTVEYFTVALYEAFAGYFIGAAVKLVFMVRQAGRLEYTQSNYLTRYLPGLFALCIIIYGLYRTNMFTTHPSTLLSWSSGASLICFGLYGWQLRIIPEFRDQGLLILDMWIPWKQVISYEWHTEESIRIDYTRSDEHISEIKSFIPPEDQLTIERLLRNKMDLPDPDT